MDTDNLVEGLVADKSERDGAARIEILRPAGHDAFDQRIGLTTDERHRFVASDAAQGFDLLADRCRQARHIENAAMTDCSQIDGCSMKQEANRAARAHMPMTHRFIDRQDRFLSDQRFAENIGEETRCRLVWLAGTNADRRQANADAIQKTLAGIIREQQFADCFLRAIAGAGRQEKLVVDLFRERRAEYGNG